MTAMAAPTEAVLAREGVGGTHPLVLNCIRVFGDKLLGIGVECLFGSVKGFYVYEVYQ